MFANTITLTVDGTGYVLNRINQDSFGSEYSHVGALAALSMKIRHSVDGVNKSSPAMKRHNVYVEMTTYATATEVEKYQTSTFTLRGGTKEDPALTSDLAAGLTTWLASGTVLADLAIGVN